MKQRTISPDEVNQALADANKSQARDKKPADAWINFSVVDKAGNEHSYNGFNPVYKDQNKLQRSLYEAALANGGEIEVTLKAVVRIAVTDDGKNYEF